MSNDDTSSNERDQYGMRPENWHRLRNKTAEEIRAAAVADPDNPPLTPEQLARLGRPLCKVVRHKLRMGREEFAAVYGIPLDTLTAWERGEAAPSATEIAYLKLIERAPDLAKLQAAE